MVSDKSRRAPHDAVAGQEDLTAGDATLLETPTGREDVSGASAHGTLLDDELRSENAPAFARDEVMAPHEPGSDADETDDGFNAVEEAVRHRAEDTPSGDGREDRPAELPVFERPLTQPKV
jgi:hypothetical protein